MKWKAALGLRRGDILWHKHWMCELEFLELGPTKPYLIVMKMPFGTQQAIVSAGNVTIRRTQKGPPIGGTYLGTAHGNLADEELNLLTDPEMDYRLDLRVVVSGYGRKRDWEKTRAQVERSLRTATHDGNLRVTIVAAEAIGPS